jgi:hypothetical protein
LRFDKVCPLLLAFIQQEQFMKFLISIATATLMALPAFAETNAEFCAKASAASPTRQDLSPAACDCVVKTMQENLTPELNALMRKAMTTAGEQERAKLMMGAAMKDPNFGPAMEKWANAQQACPTE